MYRNEYDQEAQGFEGLSVVFSGGDGSVSFD
jgi:hypothetical protein